MTEKKLDWMYKGVSGLVDREAYLTGRKIDKTFELAQREERGERIDAPVNESVPVSFLDVPSSSVSSKMLLDDPLVEIKKRQLEEARKIMANPLKMKKIKEMIEAEAKKESDKKSIKKKKKKSSSKKKHKRSRGNSSDDEKRHKHKKSHRHKYRSRSRSRSKSPSEKRKSKS